MAAKPSHAADWSTPVLESVIPVIDQSLYVRTSSVNDGDGLTIREN